MVAVNVIDGVKYGFRLLGYLLAVFIAGGILLLIGGNFAPGPFGQGNPILALIFIVAGAAVIYAGGLGVMYKVIADGVERGNLSAAQGGGLGSMNGGLDGSGSDHGGANRQRANQARQQAQQPRQGGRQRQQAGRGGNQAGRADGAPNAQGQGGQGQTPQGQQPPGDWEPGN